MRTPAVMCIVLAWLLLFSESTVAQHCLPFWAGTGTTSHLGNSQSSTHSLAVYDDGTGERLYAAGHIFNHLPWNRHTVVRWNGREWQVLDQGLPPGTTNVFDIRVLDDGAGARLYAATGQDSTRTFLYWTGQSWAQVDPAFWSLAHWPLYSFDDGSGMAVYGRRHTSTPGTYVARWDGTQWIDLGGEFWVNPPIHFVAFDSGNGPQLHVGGGFTSIDGVRIRRIARWNGSAWEPLGSGLGSTPSSMVVFDDGQGPQLYAAPVTNIAGVPVDGLIARWDGQQWSATPGGVGWPPNYLGALRRLAVYDDGRGPALYVAGLFTEAGGVPVNNLARWDGSPVGGWSRLGHGIGGSVWDIEVFDDGRGPSLFFGGTFAAAGGAPARGVVQWVGCHDQCYADCNNDQQLTIDDWLCFIDKFAIDDPYADCNQDGVRDIQDFLCFIDRFAENCR